MNLTELGRHRAQCLAALEECAGWNKSPNPKEREAYAHVLECYRRAEQRFAKATATMSQSELADFGIDPHA